MINVQLVGLMTIVRREFNRITRIWPQTLMPPIITTTLYFMIFGEFIGARIGQFNGINYIDFVIPGLVMMSVINNSYGNVVSSFFGSKFQRNIEEILVSPLWPSTILMGYIFGGMLRGLTVGVIVTLVSFVFSVPNIHHLSIIIITMILTSMLFSIAGFLNAIFARNFDDISIIPTFVLVPLTYLGGVFYSIEMLPPFWQSVSKINPVVYLINAFRYGFLGVSDFSVTLSLIFLLVFVIALWSFALYLLKKGVGIRS